MNVAPYSGILCDINTGFNRFVRQREGGVHAHHSRNLAVALPDLFDEAFVFLDSAAGLVAI